nr:ABC-three component system protein [uncultured Pseudomonas sp.]
MTEPTISLNSRTTVVAFDTPILVNGRLHLCLMQTAMPGNRVIEEDQSRPGSVLALRHLLAGGGDHRVPALREMMPGVEPVLLVAPEFAFSSVDWSAIDELIRQSNRPLIVSVGFGATVGQTLLDWVSAEHIDGETYRYISWDQDVDPISTPMPVNGGWFWYHEPNVRTTCITFLKNTSEQRVEAVALADLQHGRTILQVKFRDLEVFPLICSDLLQSEIRNEDSAQGRVRALLEAENSNRPVLIVGSLLQHGYNVNWDAAVNSFLNTALSNRASALVLCNISHDRPEIDEAKDQWRSLSGVYSRWENLRDGQANLAVARSIKAGFAVGGVIRRTDPCVATGTISWPPFNPVDGNFVWHANMVCPIVVSGLEAPIKRPAPPFTCELSRYIRRRPPEREWAPRVNLGLDKITAKINSSGNPDARGLFESILGGVSPVTADPDRIYNFFVDQACKDGLYALATLCTAENASWQEDPTMVGQIKLSEDNRHILVWRDPSRTPKQMTRVLTEWKLGLGDHPDLVVIGGSPHGGLPMEEVNPDRRTDISSAPSPETELGASGSLAAFVGDITGARVGRNVATLSLFDVHNVYTDYLQSEDLARMTELLDQIYSLFPED